MSLGSREAEERQWHFRIPDHGGNNPFVKAHRGKGSAFGVWEEAELSADPAHPRITRTLGWQESDSHPTVKILFPPDTESSRSSGAALQ